MLCFLAVYIRTSLLPLVMPAQPLQAPLHGLGFQTGCLLLFLSIIAHLRLLHFSSPWLIIPPLLLIQQRCPHPSHRCTVHFAGPSDQHDHRPFFRIMQANLLLFHLMTLFSYVRLYQPVDDLERPYALEALLHEFFSSCFLHFRSRD